MDTLPSSMFLFLFLLSITTFFVSSSGSFLSDLKPTKRAHQYKLASKSHRRELIQTTQHDFTNPPFTTYPTTPVTNPVTTPATGGGGGGIGTTTPPDTLTPPITTVPSPNPVTATPTPITIPPATDPINPPVPVTNPVTTPSTTFPGAQPGTTYPTTPAGGGTTNPVVAPPAVANAPAVPGQSWCVARGGLLETVLQVALDYACGIGGADCSAIQQGASCYNPNSLQNHASYAFNTYFQRNPVQTSCDFGGAAMITNVNPSSGSCIFTTWSSSTGSPATVSPTTTTPIPTPTTDSSTGAAPASYGTPPTVMNASNPALGGGITGFGEIPPTSSTTSSGSMSSSLNPFLCCITVAVSIITGSIARVI
ncbi:Carbohydrate-binding X8 domain superfamily protein [Perilla frutescens var. hirtella]|nr:Carbohydrate-binding X8 domain superfamily protein [Perilla frutescens var. frutescens]KAH6783224.1 Carbohydrate-binding X8 domain superfamily protein [Perilla frutescens var. hirtella]